MLQQRGPNSLNDLLPKRTTLPLSSGLRKAFRLSINSSLENKNSTSHGSFEKASAILGRSHRELIVSKRYLGKANRIHLVKMNREQRTQELCFASRPFVLCGLPVRALPPGQLIYEKRNGQFVLQITGHPKFRVPFGQDRIVPIFLATLAVQQRSQVIRFRSAGEMLEIFGMHKGGTEYRRLVAAFERIFGATIFLAPISSEVQRAWCSSRGLTSCGRLSSGTTSARTSRCSPISSRM
jgi:hypothetical protein